MWNTIYKTAVRHMAMIHKSSNFQISGFLAQYVIVWPLVYFSALLQMADKFYVLLLSSKLIFGYI